MKNIEKRQLHFSEPAHQGAWGMKKNENFLFFFIIY